MSKSTSNVVAFADPAVQKDLLTDLIRQGAQQLLNQAVEIESVGHLPSIDGSCQLRQEESSESLLAKASR